MARKVGFIAAQCALEKEIWGSAWKFFERYLWVELAITVVASVVSGVMSHHIFSWGAVANGIAAGFITLFIIFSVIVAYHSVTAPYRLWISQRKKIKKQAKILSPLLEIVDSGFTDTKLKIKDPNSGILQAKNSARYFHIRVMNLGVKNIVCKPFLVSAKKKDSQGWKELNIETMELEWGVADRHDLNLEHQVPRTVNIIVRTDDEERLTLTMFLRGLMIPISVHDAFKDLGLYELTIRIASPNVPSLEIIVEINNCEKWNQTSIKTRSKKCLAESI